MAGNPNRPLMGVWGGGASPMAAQAPPQLQAAAPPSRPGAQPEEGMFWDYQGGDYNQQPRQEEVRANRLNGAGEGPAGRDAAPPHGVREGVRQNSRSVVAAPAKGSRTTRIDDVCLQKCNCGWPAIT